MASLCMLHNSIVIPEHAHGQSLFSAMQGMAGCRLRCIVCGAQYLMLHGGTKSMPDLLQRMMAVEPIGGLVVNWSALTSIPPPPPPFGLCVPPPLHS